MSTDIWTLRLLNNGPGICDRESINGALAIEIGQHWRDQGGVSGSLLDELAKLTAGAAR